MSDVLSVRGSDVYVGETRMQGLVITLSGQTAAPTSATYQRYKSGVPVDPDPLSAVTDGNKVYANIPSGSEPGSFSAIFTFSLDQQVVKAQVMYRVLDIP